MAAQTMRPAIVLMGFSPQNAGAAEVKSILPATADMGFSHQLVAVVEVRITRPGIVRTDFSRPNAGAAEVRTMQPVIARMASFHLNAATPEARTMRPVTVRTSRCDAIVGNKRANGAQCNSLGQRPRFRRQKRLSAEERGIKRSSRPFRANDLVWWLVPGRRASRLPWAILFHAFSVIPRSRY